jgi:hypothetical protein
MTDQVISLIGAAMILLAFGAQQAGKMASRDWTYLLLNLIGSVILAIVAFRVRQWGLTLLEASWVLISLVGLTRRLQSAQMNRT